LKINFSNILDGAGKRYARNTGWLLLQRFITFPVSLIVGIYIARYLGVESFGVLSFAQGLVALFTAFAALGLDNVLVRELVKHPENGYALMGSAFWLRLVSGIITMCLVISLTMLSEITSEEKLMVGIISFSMIFQTSGVLRCYFEAKIRARSIAQSMLFQTALSAFLKILLITIEAQLFWFAVAALMDSIVLAFALFWAYRKSSTHDYPTPWKYDASTAKQLLISSWPLLLSGFALSLYMKLDQVMIRILLSPTDVGNYAAAVRISESWLILAVILTTSLYPAIISAKERGENIFLNRLQAFYSLMFWLSVLIAAPIAVFAFHIIQLVYGESYSAAAPVLAVHAWSGIMVFMITASSRWYLTNGLERSIMYRAVLGAISNICLNFLFIPHFGIIGAAYATLISYSIMAVVYDAFDPNGHKSLSLKFTSVLWPVSTAWRILKSISTKKFGNRA
jgi:O-antigen/teichoic acid export membrane protein